MFVFFSLVSVLFHGVYAQITCVNTSLLCNTCTKSCKIYYGKTFESAINFPQSFYNDTYTASIEITSFDIYLKASHSDQLDLIAELHLANSSVELFKDVGYNKVNMDVTLGDNFTRNIEWEVYNLNCKCQARTENSIIDALKDSILINAPLILKIIDVSIPNNGTFKKWCIQKFCYIKTTQSPTKMTLNPSVNPTENPVSYSNTYNFKLGTQEIVLYITLPIIVFLAVVIVILCFCYKWNESKNRQKQETYSGTIVNPTISPNSIANNSTPNNRFKRTDSGLGSDITHKIANEPSEERDIENNGMDKTIEGIPDKQTGNNLKISPNNDRNRGPTVDSTYRHPR